MVWIFHPTTTNNSLGVLILPIIKGCDYKEPHLLVIRVYRPAMESYVLSIPAGMINAFKLVNPVGLVDKGETPMDAALRELTEETGYVGTHINVKGKRIK